MTRIFSSHWFLSASTNSELWGTFWNAIDLDAASRTATDVEKEALVKLLVEEHVLVSEALESEAQE